MAERKALTIGFSLVDGKFVPDQGQAVGRVTADGHIEGTVYQFTDRQVRGGIAITTNANLRIVDEDTLENPATGAIFEKTKKGTGFFDIVNKKFVKMWGKR